MKKVLSKVKFLGQGQQWWFAFLIAAAALVAPLASNASEFPGIGAAYAQRLEQYRKISSLWLAPQALISKGDVPSKGDATFLSREQNSLHAAGMPRLLCSPSITTQPTTNSQQRATFDVSRLFSREWNLMKVTTRGNQTLAPTLGLEFKNNPFVFILK